MNKLNQTLMSIFQYLETAASHHCPVVNTAFYALQVPAARKKSIYHNVICKPLLWAINTLDKDR